MEDVKPQANDDNSYYSLFQSKSTRPIPQPSMEYDILPEVVELAVTPTPTPPPLSPPTPPKQLPTPSPSSSPIPSRPTMPEMPINIKSTTTKLETENRRFEQKPPTEIPIPLKAWKSKVEEHNKQQPQTNQVTLKGWAWFRKRQSERGTTLAGRKNSDKEYKIKATEDRKEIAKHNGEYLIDEEKSAGYRGGKRRQRIHWQWQRMCASLLNALY
ncbi:hypothetical protein DFP73DRAFT_598685 [Morchella snyderi]|nr:hypothetical protein DFP73DRAFT_598685 [Morchella snyderi]